MVDGENRIISRNSSFRWPPCSPDLNPCHYYLWGYLKSKVYCDPYTYPKTTEQLKKNIVRECRRISKETVRAVITVQISILVPSLFWPRRQGLVVRANTKLLDGYTYSYFNLLYNKPYIFY